MANQLQLRRGSTLSNSTFTGAVGEVTVDTDQKTLVVHDGSTQGGFPINTFMPAGTGAVQTNVQNKLRQTVSVMDFGAKGDGVTNDTDAFAAASAYITAQGGGTLEIPGGRTYIVGKQDFAGVAGLGYAYRPHKMLEFTNCTKPVVVNGNGAKLKLASGLKFGSFNPVTGNVYNPPSMPFYNYDYTAATGTMIYTSNCVDVVIRDIELDGNVSGQVIGGQWGDTGRQLGALGIITNACLKVHMENIYTHHHALDGVEIVWAGITTASETYPHTMMNVKSTYNGRQGLSWVGGNNLVAINCDFSHTGKNGYVSSAPGAGVDMEAESSIIRNGKFIGCRFFDNAGCGHLTVGDVADMMFDACDFIGTTNWAGWFAGLRYKFSKCQFIGATVNWVGSSTIPADAATCVDCYFSMDAARSPTGTIYSSYHNFYSTPNMALIRCSFDADTSHALPWSSGGTIYIDCNFNSASAITHYTRGYFFGYNVMITGGFWDSTGSVNYGKLTSNGVDWGQSIGTLGQVALSVNDGGSGRTNRIVGYYSPTVWAAAVGGAVVGDIVLNTGPSAGGFAGYICTASGNPGTWTPFGPIQGSNAYTVTNGSTDRALDVTGDSLAQVAAVLGTLIADLKAAKVLL